MTDSFTPTEPLLPGETVQVSFAADRATYWREMLALAIFAAAAGCTILLLMGNPHVWTGAVGGIAAIAVRAFYLASDELKVCWDLTDRRLMGPTGRIARLSEITRVNTFLSAVQVVTRGGDKHLIKYQKDRAATAESIRAAIGQTQKEAGL